MAYAVCQEVLRKILTTSLRIESGLLCVRGMPGGFQVILVNDRCRSCLTSEPSKLWEWSVGRKARRVAFGRFVPRVKA